MKRLEKGKLNKQEQVCKKKSPPSSLRRVSRLSLLALVNYISTTLGWIAPRMELAFNGANQRIKLGRLHEIIVDFIMNCLQGTFKSGISRQ